jgi:acetyl-CoA carboxylase biotin carboxyl carrier protein
MPLSEDDVREILRLIDESDVEELRIETDELSLYVQRGDARTADAAQASPDAEERSAVAHPDGAGSDALLTVAAPMLGTFYRAEAPGAVPFVDVGTRVEPGTVVCLIEVMKMMNAVPAGVTGTIAEICADNAQPVEYGAALFRVRPDR